MDINDCPPIIEVYGGDEVPVIPEETESGRFLTFSVTDNDSEKPNNDFEAPVVTSEECPDPDCFEVRCRPTGDCDALWKKKFDREKTTEITIKIETRDKGDPSLQSPPVEVGCIILLIFLLALR